MGDKVACVVVVVVSKLFLYAIEFELLLSFSDVPLSIMFLIENLSIFYS